MKKKNMSGAERAAQRAEQRTAIIKRAEAANAEYKQYRGHWSGTEWRLGRVRRRTGTKFGLAFDANEVTLCKWSDVRNMAPHVVAYSAKNNIDTMIAVTKIEWLEEPPPPMSAESEIASRHAPAGAGSARALCDVMFDPVLALPGETVTCQDCLNVIAHVRTSFNLDGSLKRHRT